VKWLAVAMVGAALVGCAPPEEPTSSTPSTPPKIEDIPLTSKAGVPVTSPTEPVAAKTITVGKSFVTRADPFALRPNERQFERNQETLRVFGDMGWTVQYTPPPEEQKKPEDIPEPQPYRRLAGVVVGDSILALIDMGDGTLEVIRPGQAIPNSQWRVISIDSEKAILRRSGNQTPRQIIVRLESPPGGVGGGVQPGGGGFPGGGRPGAGFSGGPGRPGAGFSGGGGRGAGGGSKAEE
jgi:hypothetical protein